MFFNDYYIQVAISNPFFQLLLALSVVYLAILFFKKSFFSHLSSEETASTNYEITAILSGFFSLFLVFVVLIMTEHGIMSIVYEHYPDMLSKTPLELASYSINNAIVEYRSAYIRYNTIRIILAFLSSQKTGFAVSAWGFRILAFPSLKYIYSFINNAVRILGFVPFAPFLAQPIILMIISLTMMNYVFPAGVILRFLPFKKARIVGSLLISMAISAYWIYPAFLAVNLSIINNEMSPQIIQQDEEQRCLRDYSDQGYKDFFNNAFSQVFNIGQNALASAISAATGTITYNTSSNLKIPTSPCFGLMLVEHLSFFFFKLFYSTTLSIIVSIMFMKVFTKILSFEIVEYMGKISQIRL